MGGHYIECSPEHKFLCRKTNGREYWTTAERLATVSKNVRIVLTDPVPEWSIPVQPPEADIQAIWNSRTVSVVEIANKRELGIWLGRIASDGCVQHRTVRLLVAEHEKELLDSLRPICERFGVPVREESVIKEGYENPMHYLEICSTSLANQLRAAQVKSRIPEFVWADSVLLSAYLKGQFDGDGTVHPDGALLTFGGGTRHLDWAREVQEALLLLGIRSRLRAYPGEQGSVRLQILKYDMPLFTEHIGFLNSKKQQQARAVKQTTWKGAAAYGRAASVKSVEITDLWVPMYDVIDSETCRFMANGIVVHNSNADILKIALAKFYAGLRGGKLNGPNLYGGARFMMAVHDEIVCTARNEYVGPVAAILEAAMTDAYTSISKVFPDGKTYWLKDIYNKVDVVTGDYWSKE